jgi:hypothetical protein
MPQDISKYPKTQEFSLFQPQITIIAMNIYFVIQQLVLGGTSAQPMQIRNHDIEPLDAVNTNPHQDTARHAKVTR